MRPLILMTIVLGLVAAGAIGFLVAVLIDEDESTPVPTELVLPTPEKTEIPAVLATTSPDAPFSETYGPGIVGRQRYRDSRFDDLSCTEKRTSTPHLRATAPAQGAGPGAPGAQRGRALDSRT